MYEGLWKKLNDTGFKDYKELTDMFSTCSCKGRPPKDKPRCERNKEQKRKHDNQGYCIHYRINGTLHCDHKYPYREPEEEKEVEPTSAGI
jgi:hypothetical protein